VTAPKFECRGTARIDGPYRYDLWRIWGDPDGPYMLFCMLNPSTADASEDDATIRRCIGFARRARMDRLCVVNLYAWRATRPADLFKAQDPVGPMNDFWISEHAKHAAQIVAAWGGEAKNDRAFWVAYQLRRFNSLYCLGKTKYGCPKHPLYLSNNTVLSLYL